MTSAIIGWTGFVGQHIASKVKDSDLYNSSNINHIKNKQYDIVYFCGMPAEKWKINLNPEPDYNNTVELMNTLSTITTKRFVLISTVDIFDCSVNQDESGTVFAEHSYGKHRRMMEEFVEKTFPIYNIIRLPGLFGKGLKKNIIYDLIFDNQITNICLESEFQWYNIENVMDDITYCISKNISHSQLVSPPISVNTIISKFFPDKLSMAQGKTCAKYCLKTQHNNNGYWNTTEKIFNDLANYINYETKLKKLPCKLAVSNIAWNHSNFSDILKILNSNRINSLEIAPTKICNWSDWTDETISNLKSFKISFIGCQSILFNTTIQVFKNSEELISHYTKVCKICNKLDIKTIVFGSPKARHLNGKSEEEAIYLFRQLGDISKENNIILCIEPNSKLYNCTWLTNVSETIEFIRKVDHTNVLINYDLGNYLMENDTFIFDNKTVSHIGHIQISNSYLKPLSELTETSVNVYSKQLSHILKLGYSKNISLEMIETSYYELLNSLEVFIKLIM